MWTIQQSQIGRIAIPPALPPGIALFTTTRDYFGRITTELAHDLTAVARDRFGVDSVLTTCNQVHGKRVERANASKTWRECDSCDALWTGETHTALGIKVADCLPVTMVDSTHSVIANVHSGWRGAVQQITAETIDTIVRETAFDTASAFAYLGPSIRTCCFEVGEEVAEQFDAKYVAREWGTGNPAGQQDRRDRLSSTKPHVDLVAFTTDILRQRGFAAERISDSELCTRCDGSLFHSFRRDGKGGGRNLVVVAQ
ncbi:MAG TPA: polyphenol oxidase family protein [Thermoanaerobaculia bacterium]|nr:polyphenol oxidase family protein [Thermoanaerobaculia bacterium]